MEAAALVDYAPNTQTKAVLKPEGTQKRVFVNLFFLRAPGGWWCFVPPLALPMPAGTAALLLLLLAAPTFAAPFSSLGALQSLSCAGPTCSLTAAVTGSGAPGPVPLRLSFYGPSTIRYWLAVDGNFSDNGAADDVIVLPPAATPVTAQDDGAYWTLSQPPAPGAPNVTVRLQKAPLLLTILVAGLAVVQEATPLSWDGTASWQTLVRDAPPFPAGLSAEHFFGGGMQNGRWAHRDEAIDIGVDYDWDDGGHSNSAPWFVSSAGYGVLRNTWAPGTYDFASPVRAAHNESNRLDAFFLMAPPGPGSIKTILGLYTQLTGPPFLPPLYALFLGDSDCYHNDRHGNSTLVAVSIGRLYEEHDMPRGWLLVNG